MPRMNTTTKAKIEAARQAIQAADEAAQIAHKAIWEAFRESEADETGRQRDRRRRHTCLNMVRRWFRDIEQTTGLSLRRIDKI